MSVLFVLGTVFFFMLAAVVLVQVRRRLSEVGELWYGLVPIGAAGALVALLVQMGLLYAYAALTDMPAEMTRRELTGRLDIVLFNTVLIGVLLEIVKVYVVHLFHTRIERGNWPLYGMAVGAGSGLLQALLVLGPTAWVAGMGGMVVEVHHLWLLPQHVALVAMEVALGGMVLYQCALDRQWIGVTMGGVLHAAALFVPALLEQMNIVSSLLPMVRTAIFAAVALTTGAILASWVKRKGWPF